MPFSFFPGKSHTHVEHDPGVDYKYGNSSIFLNSTSEAPTISHESVRPPSIPNRTTRRLHTKTNSCNFPLLKATPTPPEVNLELAEIRPWTSVSVFMLESLRLTPELLYVLAGQCNGNMERN